MYLDGFKKVVIIKNKKNYAHQPSKGNFENPFIPMMTYTTLRITFISKLFGLFDMISQILGEPGKMGF